MFTSIHPSTYSFKCIKIWIHQFDNAFLFIPIIAIIQFRHQIDEKWFLCDKIQELYLSVINVIIKYTYFSLKLIFYQKGLIYIIR